MSSEEHLKGLALIRKGKGKHSSKHGIRVYFMETKLNLISKRALKDRKCKFNNLMHLINVLSAKLRGHFQYYGVSGNFRGIKRFNFNTIKLVFKWLNRRSQKKSFNWQEFQLYLERFPLPKPKIYHNLYFVRTL